MTVAATDSIQSPAPAAPAAASGATSRRISLLCIVLWPALGLVCLQNLSWLDTLNMAGLCAALVISLALLRGARATASHAGRVWTVVAYLLAVLLLSPGFLCGGSFSTDAAGAALRGPALVVFIQAWSAVLIWAFTRPARPALAAMGEVFPDTEAPPPEQRLEEFVSSPRVRANLLIFFGILLLISVWLTSQPYSSLVPELIALALSLLALRPLLQHASHRAGARAMRWSAALVLAVAAVFGAARYLQCHALVDEMHSLLKAGKWEEAAEVRAKSGALNATLKSGALNLRIETEWAEFYESRGDFPSAGERWGKVADLRGISRAEFLPGLRVLWKMGDSLSAWRRLVYAGFPAIKEPEIAQGILEMGDKPGADLRARLTGALLACELRNPPDDCKRRLESVQAVAPRELSSHELLERMGAVAYERALNLPLELLVGHEPRYNAVTATVDNGTIEEQGELRTIVVLGKGHYEMMLIAHGAMLLDQWPIVRVELDDQVIGHTQVNEKEDHSFPFTFNINADNVYVLRIVFENYVDALDQGKIARRGLGISSITFQRSKD